MSVQDSSAAMKQSVKLGCLTPELTKIALEEINETPEQRDRNIQLLRKMIAEEKGLRSRTDDAFLLRFLRSCCHDVDFAFQTVRKFYAMKIKYPSMYVNFRPSAQIKTLNENLGLVLPDRDAYGRRVIVVKFGQWNPRTSTVDDNFICLQMCMEAIVSEEETQVCGVVSVLDLRGFGLHHVPYIGPSTVKKFGSFVQDFYPLRFRACHYVNEPPIFGTIFQMMKIFLRTEVFNMMHFHGRNLKSLHEYVSPDILPEELGGSKPPMDNSPYVKALLLRDDEIADSIMNYGYDSKT